MVADNRTRLDPKLLGVQWFVHLLVIFVCVGEPVPGVNESHYLTKAKHFMNPAFAPGDLFLESHDSHLVSTCLAGFLTEFLSLDVVAWVGRLVAWSLMAFAWLRLASACCLSPMVSPFALATWYYGIDFGNWAGEWAIGGFEGKSIAYPCVLMGVASAIEDRWRSSWIWLSAAIVWHPLVGGWAGLTVGLAWFFSRGTPGFRSQLPYWFLATAVSLLGVIPALSGIGGPDREGNLVASQIHVYFRLGHHLCPLAFDPVSHVAAVTTMTTFVFCNLALWVCARICARHIQDGVQPPVAIRRLTRVLSIAWFSVFFAAIGLFVDVVFSNPDWPSYQPVLASKILRFYWFRWYDVAVPLACSLVFWALAGASLGSSARGGEGTKLNAPLRSVSHALLCIGILATVACIGVAVRGSWINPIPSADKLVVDTFGERRKIDWGSSHSNRYVDWLAVCDWIRTNTPTDSLWLSPKYQQTFKWHAQRAEVVCWKDVPQDNTSLIEWYKRVSRCEPPRDAIGRIRGWTDGELLQLSQEYGFEYVLVDRTYYAPEDPPPRFEILYPVDSIDNRSFAVFRIRK